MNVERDLLGVCGPFLVAEAVCVFSVVLGDKGVVTSGDTALVGLKSSDRVVDLGPLLETRRNVYRAINAPRSQHRGSRLAGTLCRRPGR